VYDGVLLGLGTGWGACRPGQRAALPRPKLLLRLLLLLLCRRQGAWLEQPWLARLLHRRQRQACH
jgi:hypothetical protein